MQIGAQLYTARGFCKSPEELSETLKKIADIGYRTVQVSGTCEYDPAWLKAELEKNGLTCVLTHIPREKLVADPAAVAAEHDVFGCDRVGLGFFRVEDKDGSRLSDFFEIFRPVARQLRAHGKQFMYHNHDHEFRKIDGKTILEQMAETIPPEEMGFTLDTYWVQAGGGDPAEWLRRFTGRVPCIHLKDFAYGHKMAVLGEGNLCFDRIFKAAKEAGTEVMLVEQDDCYGEDPFDCLTRSYRYLRANGFE